ncbi:hypothetical protein SAMN04487911_1511 [Arenibacter nanhaiticus]|uniref:Uncharacterized protein n=1 Tax=Arenibacter nanhaiticus TaxID=558155 RepID=A0A1M6MYW6_9FLAO|nr:hypothetical protein SAMN04487911_1511 [Arenibacter nanhaiticus]
MLVYWNTTNVKFHYRTAQYETRTLGGVRGAVRFYLGADPSTRLYAGLFSKYVIMNYISGEVH